MFLGAFCIGIEALGLAVLDTGWCAEAITCNGAFPFRGGTALAGGRLLKSMSSKYISSKSSGLAIVLLPLI